MNDQSSGKPSDIPDETVFSLEKLIVDIHTRLHEGKRLRRTVFNDGRLRIDRSLPFLCVYRKPPDGCDIGTVELVTTEASYLFVSGDDESVELICEAVREVSQKKFGAFLLIEFWTQDLSDPSHESTEMLHPSFRIDVPDNEALLSTAKTLEKSLGEIRLSKMHSQVSIRNVTSIVPPNLKPLFAELPADSQTFFHIGIAVHPVFRRADELFPIVLQNLRRQLAVAIRKMLFTFTHDVLDEAPRHYQAFGPTSLVKATSLVDQQLSDISTSFDYLLQITPVNAYEAWEAFQASGFKKQPVFYYRPLSRDPTELKRALFDVPIDRIEDPTLSELFWEKQDELEHQLTSLRDIDTPQFLYSSLQLYGEVETDLLKMAEKLLELTTDSVDEESSSQSSISCDELVARAQEEVAFYRQLDSSFHASVQRSNSIAAGIMISKDTILVNENIKVKPDRVEAMMHHEVGTHLLTFFNGRHQPFQQMYAGLSGYESFQEGIAVLSEYLVGGLDRTRVRTLAARVVAANQLLLGRSFIETFSQLKDEYGFGDKAAFNLTTRIYRGGGTTKDVIYLRGLRDVLTYLTDCDAVEIDRLFVGKIALKHMPAINDLMYRDIIKPPKLMPRYLSDPTAQELLSHCVGLDVIGLLDPDSSE